MDAAKPGKGISSILSVGVGMIMMPSANRLVIIGKGRVFAGIDLKVLKAKDVITTGDSIHVSLPAAQILNTVINPSGFETFDEKGDWNEEAVTALKLRIKNELTKRPLQQNILRKVEERSKNIIETFLRVQGLKKIHY